MAPIAKILHEKYSILSGYVTTIHAYTADQKLLDSSHKDLRRARNAASSMIPTKTGATKTIGQIIPDLEGKLSGSAIRVPTSNVSLIDLSVCVNSHTNIGEIHNNIERYRDLIDHSIGLDQELYNWAMQRHMKLLQEQYNKVNLSDEINFTILHGQDSLLQRLNRIGNKAIRNIFYKPIISKN